MNTESCPPGFASDQLLSVRFPKCQVRLDSFVAFTTSSLIFRFIINSLQVMVVYQNRKLRSKRIRETPVGGGGGADAGAGATNAGQNKKKSTENLPILTMMDIFSTVLQLVITLVVYFNYANSYNGFGIFSYGMLHVSRSIVQYLALIKMVHLSRKMLPNFARAHSKKNKVISTIKGDRLLWLYFLAFALSTLGVFIIACLAVILPPQREDGFAALLVLLQTFGIVFGNLCIFRQSWRMSDFLKSMVTRKSSKRNFSDSVMLDKNVESIINDSWKKLWLRAAILMTVLLCCAGMSSYFLAINSFPWFLGWIIAFLSDMCSLAGAFALSPKKKSNSKSAQGNTEELVTGSLVKPRSGDANASIVVVQEFNKTPGNVSPIDSRKKNVRVSVNLQDRVLAESVVFSEQPLFSVAPTSTYFPGGFVSEVVSFNENEDTISPGEL